MQSLLSTCCLTLLSPCPTRDDAGEAQRQAVGLGGLYQHQMCVEWLVMLGCPLIKQSAISLDITGPQSLVVSTFYQLRSLPSNRTSRSLQTTKNPVFARFRRHAAEMPELHKVKKRLQLLASRSASTRGATTAYKVNCGYQVPPYFRIVIVITTACRWSFALSS